MTKQLLSMSFLIGLSLAVSAQVSVNRHGQLVAGKTSVGVIGTLSTVSTDASPNLLDPVLPTITTDSLSQICVLGRGNNGSGGYITFGDNKKVFVGELLGSGSMDYNRLQLYSTGGLRYDIPSGTVFSYIGTTFNFNCNVKVDGVSVTSDSRLKSDVQDISGTVSSFAGITPVSYTLAPAASSAVMTQADVTADATASMRVPADERERFGFIAQEVREIFPQLVSEDENGYLSVDYIGFIPLLVDAVKELSAKVDEQQQVIASLRGEQQPMRKQSVAGIDTLVETVASLSQNTPNPFSQTTVIAMTLPEDVAEAIIYIYDLQGRQVMTLPVEGRGATSVSIDGKTLNPGMFIYTLIADGKEVATKRMILTD